MTKRIYIVLILLGLFLTVNGQVVYESRMKTFYSYYPMSDSVLVSNDDSPKDNLILTEDGLIICFADGDTLRFKGLNLIKKDSDSDFIYSCDKFTTNELKGKATPDLRKALEDKNNPIQIYVLAHRKPYSDFVQGTYSDWDGLGYFFLPQLEGTIVKLYLQELKRIGEL